MICVKCGGSLFSDPSVERAYRVEGRTGTRLYCLMGCTSRYVTTGVDEPLRVVLPARRPITLKCKTRKCGAVFQSLTSVRKWCDACKLDREQRKGRRYRARRSALALSTPVPNPDRWTAHDTHRAALAGLGRR